jgi:hypothetical protein
MAIQHYLASFAAKAVNNMAVRWIERLWRERVRQERIVYDGRRSISPGDVSGHGSVRYDTQGQPFGKRGEGHHNVTGGIIDVTRTNTAGRYEIRLERLRIGPDVVRTLEPAPHLTSRTLTFSFQAKAQGGNHSLVTVIRNPYTGAWLGNDTRPVTFADWRSYSFAIHFASSDPAMIRFDDQDVSTPNSLQIRRLLVTEHLN